MYFYFMTSSFEHLLLPCSYGIQQTHLKRVVAVGWCHNLITLSLTKFWNVLEFGVGKRTSILSMIMFTR